MARRTANPGQSELQRLLFEDDIADRFERWKATPGGAHLMRHAYRISAGYGARFIRTGRRVSVKLVWELLRDRLDWIRPALAARGIHVRKINGFALNNIFTAHVARHIMQNHVAGGRRVWLGLFETRELGAGHGHRRVTIVKIDEAPKPQTFKHALHKQHGL